MAEAGNGTPPPAPAGGLRFVSAHATDVGPVREHNEDAWLDRPEIGLWVVADGMGGHEAGDHASRSIVESLGQVALPASAADFLLDVKARLLDVHDGLRVEADRRGPGTIIASTVVALLAFNHHFACLWAGDSRLYRLRGEDLRQVTRDHSHVQDLVELGLLTPEEAEGHPQANVVTRAVGGSEALALEMRQDRLAAGDIFLLASDGLTRVVPPADIAMVLASEEVADVARILVDLALARGTRDNVTVVAMQCLAPPGGNGA